MPGNSDDVTATIEVTDGILTLVARGRLDAAGMRGLQDQVRAHPAYRSDLNFLADVRGCDLSSLTRDDIRDIAGAASPFATSGKSALVVADDLGFGMARMFEILRSGGSPLSKVFRDVDEARRWLLEGTD